MKLSEYIEKMNLELMTKQEFEDNDISGCYCGDLLSWVMGRAKPGDVWITIMSNINIVAVASLVDAACILLAEGTVIEEEIIKKADMQGVVIVRSTKTTYELAAGHYSVTGN